MISGTFLPTFRDNPSLLPSRVKNYKMLVGNYHYSLRNRPEDRSFQGLTPLKLTSFSSDIFKYFGTNNSKTQCTVKGDINHVMYDSYLRTKSKGRSQKEQSTINIWDMPYVNV
jgi:hypothetical protein